MPTTPPIPQKPLSYMSAQSSPTVDAGQVIRVIAIVGIVGGVSSLLSGMMFLQGFGFSARNGFAYITQIVVAIMLIVAAAMCLPRKPPRAAWAFMLTYAIAAILLNVASRGFYFFQALSTQLQNNKAASGPFGNPRSGNTIEMTAGTASLVGIVSYIALPLIVILIFRLPPVKAYFR